MWKERVNETLVKVTGYQLSKPVTPKGKRSAPIPKRGRPPTKKSEMTIAQGWDTYAKERRQKKRVGDVWNRPSLIGMDVERPQDVVPYLDREVFTPFLGTVGTIVEIGPGGGRFTEVLLPKCHKFIAVDTSPVMIELLKERFPEETKIEYHVSKGRGLPEVGDESVDAAFSYGVFVHLQHWDIFNYLQELNRVLKPGGKALIHHSNTFSDLGWK